MSPDKPMVPPVYKITVVKHLEEINKQKMTFQMFEGYFQSSSA